MNSNMLCLIHNRKIQVDENVLRLPTDRDTGRITAHKNAILRPEHETKTKTYVSISHLIKSLDSVHFYSQIVFPSEQKQELRKKKRV